MAGESQSKWYIGNTLGEHDGPYSTDQIVSMRLSRRVDDDTPCWRQGMDEWMKLGQVSSLTALIHSRRRRARRRVWAVAASVVLIAVGVAAGVFVLRKLTVPKAVAGAERLLDERKYREAGQTVQSYLKSTGYENPHALTIMGVAAVGHYAAGDPDDRANTSDLSFDAFRQQAESIDTARQVFQRAFDRDPSWRSRAAEYLSGIIGEVPDDAPDLCDRCVRISQLLDDLGIVDLSGLAPQALAKYRSAAGGVAQAGCAQDFAEFVLLGVPGLGSEFVSAVYRFGCETPAGQKLGAPGRMFVSWTEHNPKLAPTLGTGLTEYARTATAAGNYAECDDALAAAIRIDDKLAPQASEIWLASLTSHFESGTLADETSREQLVRRLNELTNMAGVDVQAVADLYLAHRTELVSSDPQVESRLSRQLREAANSRGGDLFFRSGQELLTAGDYAAAVAELTRVPNSSPLYSAAGKLLGKAEHQLQLQLAEKSLKDRNYAAAERAFRQALSLKPDDETATAGLNRCLAMAKQHAIAEGISRANDMCEGGQADEARSILSRLLETYPKEAAVVAALHDLNERFVGRRLQQVRELISRREFESAETEVQSILADLPENTEAAQLLDKVQVDLVADDCEQVTSLIAAKRFAEAESVIARALKRRPSDSQAVALHEQVAQTMANPETTDISGKWVTPDGIRLVLTQNGDQVSVVAETLTRNVKSWEGAWERSGKTLNGNFQVALHGMSEPASIDVRAEIQDSRTINVFWRETTWRNPQKTRGRGYGKIDWVRADADTNTRR